MIMLQAFIRAWEGLCGDKSPDPTLIIPSGKTFLIKPVAFNGPCKSPRVYIKVKKTHKLIIMLIYQVVYDWYFNIYLLMCSFWAKSLHRRLSKDGRVVWGKTFGSVSHGCMDSLSMDLGKLMAKDPSGGERRLYIYEFLCRTWFLYERFELLGNKKALDSS